MNNNRSIKEITITWHADEVGIPQARNLLKHIPPMNLFNFHSPVRYFKKSF